MASYAYSYPAQLSCLISNKLCSVGLICSVLCAVLSGFVSLIMFLAPYV